MRTKSKLLGLTILVDILLVIAILNLMNYVQLLLNEDIRINLSEIVTQNKDVISSRLTLELNNLETDAKQLLDKPFTYSELDQNLIEQNFLDYVERTNDERLVFAFTDGNAISATGQNINILGRSYFQLGMNGTSNISERLISRIDGEDVFVLCVPLQYNNKIVGTLQKHYTPQEMYDICAVSLFSEQGFSYIINSQGYILICSQSSQYNRESDNYYRIIYLSDPDASKRLEEDIQNNRAGFFEAVIDGKQVFSAYTPIEQIHDWYLISSIDTQAVSPNGTIVVKLFYCILIGVALLFFLSTVYYWYLKRKQQVKLEQLAFVDSVTDGSSYTKFIVDLQKILQANQNQKFYLCSIDIDNFKYINSFYGYDTGDRILYYLYHHYFEKLHPNERIARVSADQFVMLLENISEERLENLIELEVLLDTIKIYLSGGIYRIDNSALSVNFMVDRASTAARKSKGRHFKQIEYYSEEYDKVTLHNEQTKRAVELALEENEIIAFFQPKIDINTGRLAGAEALARWLTKDGNYISPAEFIPICEQTGLITLVDLAIFEQTLQFIQKSLDSGVSCVPISVNISRLHLHNQNFLNMILNKLDEYQVPPELIELELTETVMFENDKLIKEFIHDLHLHGLKISMDDFGSGYSSLHMLKDIDIDVLKIDRGFLLGSEDDERQKAIFGAVVQMANKLQITVVVEGVETIENVNLMKEFNCSYAQGYYFAKPMNENEFNIIYKEGRL